LVYNLDISDEGLKATEKALRMVLNLADKLSTLRLSPAAKTVADKNRQAAEKEKAKQMKDVKEEEILKKKKEKDQRFQEKLKSLPPDQQRKLEEKKRKKEVQKQKSKMSKIMKF